jgi:hypothetical protein
MHVDDDNLLSDGGNALQAVLQVLFFVQSVDDDGK